MDQINILVIDDHPTMIEGYKSILTFHSKPEIKLIKAYNCESAYTLITTTKTPFEIVLLDLNLPPFESQKLYSGEDLAILIKKIFPQTKIMILTSHTETFFLFNLIKKINPEGLLIKSDFAADEFLNAFNIILNGGSYFSATAKQSLKNIYSKNNYLDAYNRRIISLLAKGIATKNLPEHLNISLSAIDKRKALIKDYFEIIKGNDEDIIREAKKKGFI